jgi:7,8-dihydropterin-6-yl-methyl-4-(beta-D-ribofuranosyl)aminobenzene 5'-phosphate synthase
MKYYQIIVHEHIQYVIRYIVTIYMDESIVKAHTVTVTILIENTVSRSDLKAEHGLSMLVETSHGTILWDTGQSSLFIENARKMGVSLDTIDHVALSHGHYDHTGGLSAILALKPDVHVHGHPELFTSRYSKQTARETVIRAVGSHVSQDDINASCGSLTLERYMSELFSGVFLTGEIPQISGVEETGGGFFLDEVCEHRDTLYDDQALIIESTRGIIVLLGCAHAGVINTLNHIAHLTSTQKIYAVLGGLHLLRASDERLEETAAVLERYNVQLIGPCHCTGSRAMAFIQSRFPDRFLTCETGTCISFVDE